MPSDPVDPTTARTTSDLSDVLGVLRAVNERLVLTSVREQELADASERQRLQLRALLDALSEGVIIAEETGKVLMVNPVARKLLGLTMDATPTLAIIDAYDFRNLDDSRLSSEERPLRRALRGEAVVEMEGWFVRDGQATIRVASTATSIPGGDGPPLAIVVFRDVTERRRLEERVSQIERLAAIGTLSAGIAHELNTPLAYILANVDFALEALPEITANLAALEVADDGRLGGRLAATSEALAEAREGGRRVQGVVQDLKRFGRPDVREHSVLALDAVLESALRLTASYVRKSATVRREFRDAPPVFANEGQLAQVFINLLLNATHAMSGQSHAASEIVVRTYAEEGRAVAEIRDTGPGIPLDLRRRVFDPFFTTKAVGEGSGLGLSLCHSIVEHLGGQLTLTSEGPGATFRVVLPAALVTPAVEAARPPTPVPARRGRVLLIDDEPALGRAFARMLQRDHDVTLHTDARLALAQLQAGETFDIIMCDISMPDLNGMQFLAALRRTCVALVPRVVFVTGGAFDEEAASFLAATTQHTLTKPVNASVLRHLIAEYVRRADA